MIRFANPDSIGKPFSRYSHTAIAPENCRWVHISGQVGARRDGTILKGFEAQCRQTWANVLHALRAGGMGLDDIVKTNIFLTRADDIVVSRRVREEALQGRAPASTLLIVAGLAHPDLLLEVEVIAAQPMQMSTARRTVAKATAKTKAKARPKAKATAKAKQRAKARTTPRAKAKSRKSARRR